MYKTKILSTGIYTPKTILTNKDIEKIVDTSDQWITERTGIKERRVAKHELGETPTNMAKWATEEALKKIDFDKNDIDLILFATCTPDYRIPSCSTILQHKLEIKNKCACLDIGAACSGFVYGMVMADSFIKSGLYKNVLVVGSELLSQEVDWKDRATCILFGDGCGVALFGRSDSSMDSEVYSTVLSADGSGGEFFMQEIGGTLNPITEENVNDPKRYMKMNGQEMFKVAVRTLAQNAKKMIRNAGIKTENVDWVVPHQANERIISSTAKLLGVPMEKWIINIDRFGNTSAATIPIAFHEAITDEKIKRGDVVLFDTFGAGVTSAACIFKY